MRAVRFAPAFHRCTDPKGNFGIGGVRMMWMLRVGPDAIGWDVSTGWDLPAEEFVAMSPGCTHPMHQGSAPPPRGGSGGAVDWHTSKPRYEGQQFHDFCEFTNGQCYMDTGFLLGDDLFDLLRTDGDEAVWTRMRQLLNEVVAESLPAS
jgi:hypothetical protein